MMNRTGRAWRGIAALTLICISTWATAQDGAALYKAKNCHTCHGEAGAYPIGPGYPIIAGQNAEYLLRQMIDIRDGHRANGLSATMKAVVGEVSDEEFRQIAQWLTTNY
jgi:cytochrome c